MGGVVKLLRVDGVKLVFLFVGYQNRSVWCFEALRYVSGF